MSLIRQALILVSLAGIAGCGDIPVAPQPSSGCTAGSAEILVGDGYLKNLCGCAEAAGTLAPAGTSLTCTLSGSATVFFHYLGTQLQHQIAPVGTPAFVMSPVSDPLALAPIQVHAIQLSASGTYQFQDALNSALSGQLIIP